MAAGGYATHRELLNCASGVFNGYRYRGEIGQNVVMGPRSANDCKRPFFSNRGKWGLERGHLLGIKILEKDARPRGIPDRVAGVGPIMGAGIR